jgi:juvenile hormone epoxide hydrolase
MLLALSHNPVGLAAWILEKFSTATNRKYRGVADGGFENDFKLDALLDNVMIYYLTNTAVTSARIYKEAMNKAYPMDRVAVEVPVGAAHFRNEIQHQFNFLTQERFKKIIHNSYFEHGGHFAALQLPDVLYKDFVAFVKKTL